MRTRGFTLIELLVVISIIGLLSSVVLASLTTARAKAKNSARSSLARQYQTALELYYNDNGQYPNPLGVPLVVNYAIYRTGGANWNGSALMCLGQTSSGNCIDLFWWAPLVSTVNENATLKTMLDPYIKGMPGDNTVITASDGTASRGILYACMYMTGTKCAGYSLYYELEGNNRVCPGSFVTYTDPTWGVTVCDNVQWN